MPQITGKELAELNEAALANERERAERASYRRMYSIGIDDANRACYEALQRGDKEDAVYWANESLRLKVSLHSIPTEEN